MNFNTIFLPIDIGCVQQKVYFATLKVFFALIGLFLDLAGNNSISVDNHETVAKVLCFANAILISTDLS